MVGFCVNKLTLIYNYALAWRFNTMPKTTMAKNNATIELTFTFERETKNTIRFTEKTADMLDTPQVGTLYLQKASLKAMGWQEGKDIKMTLNVK